MSVFSDRVAAHRRRATSGAAPGPGRRRRFGMLAAAGLSALTVAACGSSSNTSTTSTSGGSSSTTAATSASSGTATAATTTASSSTGGVAAAKAAIAPYLSSPSPFPATVPLGKSLPAGTKFAYLECGAPICALVDKLLAPAVKAVGGELETVNAGLTSTSSQAAASSVLSMKPKVAIITGIEPALYGNTLKQLSAAGVKVISISVAGPTKQYGIDFNYVGLPPLEKAGRLLADWVVANKGPNSNVVFYEVPEIAFNPYMKAAFKAELAKNCPSCSLRFQPISITTIGTTAPSQIVSDLQSHPKTTVAVFESAELADGLPAALKAAGISVTTLGYTPQPEELNYIKAGEMTAGLASDIATQMWTTVDIGARLALGESPTAGEIEGFGPDQFLDQKQITFNTALGWTGYPDFAQRFAKLWHPAS